MGWGGRRRRWGRCDQRGQDMKGPTGVWPAVNPHGGVSNGVFNVPPNFSPTAPHTGGVAMTLHQPRTVYIYPKGERRAFWTRWKWPVPPGFNEPRRGPCRRSPARKGDRRIFTSRASGEDGTLCTHTYRGKFRREKLVLKGVERDALVFRDRQGDLEDLPTSSWLRRLRKQKPGPRACGSGIRARHKNGW